MTKLFRSFREALRSPQEVRALKLSLSGVGRAEELSHFPNLEELYLEGGFREFPLPGPLPQLQVLSLKLPDFEGDIGEAFKFPALRVLKVLQTPLRSLSIPLGLSVVNVESVTFKGCALANLPEEISLLKNLRELSLPQNALESLPASFDLLRSLGRLNLDHNCFRDFPAQLQHMPALKHLSLDGNPFPQEEKDRIQREFHIWVN